MGALAVRNLPVIEDAPRQLRLIQGGAVARTPTLDDLFGGAWSALTSARPAACPACGDAMAPVFAADGAAVGGRCDGCGSTLR